MFISNNLSISINFSFSHTHTQTDTNKRLRSKGIHPSEIYLEIRERRVFDFVVTLYIYLLPPLMYILVYAYLQISTKI